MAVRTCRSVWVLELGTSVALAGDGITGDRTGTTGESPITTTPISHTAEPLPTVTISLTEVRTEVRSLIVPADFTGARPQEEAPVPAMDLRHHTASPVPALERSAALIMAASREGIPSVGVQASAEGSTVAVADSTVVVDPTEAVVAGRWRLSRSQ
jgi:hypothetical protein